MSELRTDAIRMSIGFIQNEANGVMEESRNIATDQLQALLDALATKDARITELEAMHNFYEASAHWDNAKIDDDDEIERLDDEIKHLREENQSLTATIERVRELHKPYISPEAEFDVCAECYEYPCPTIQALEGESNE